MKLSNTKSVTALAIAVLLSVATIAAQAGQNQATTSATTKTEGEGYTAYSLPAKSIITPITPTHPSYVALLLGGHGDVDEATQIFCAHTGGGEIVVLRATEADEYNAEFHEVCPHNSVTTLVITSRDGAAAPFVSEKLKAAHGIYISGGDQSNYIRDWTHTPVQEIINSAVARGVPIGGISAGLAVQGEFVFSAMIDTVTSEQALANPYDPLVTLSRDFLVEPGMKGILTDSHFSQRERLGRSIVFLSRVLQDGWADSVRGIGIDETTAVVLDASRHARVLGQGAAYFMTLDHHPEICEWRKPLTVSDVQILKVQAAPNATFDFNSWTSPSAVALVANVSEGKLSVTAASEHPHRDSRAKGSKFFSRSQTRSPARNTAADDAPPS